MKKETKANNVFQRVEVSRDEAVAMAEKGALASLGERPGSAEQVQAGYRPEHPNRREDHALSQR